MAQPDHEREDPQELDGMDPRDWEDKAPELWGLLQDIEALDRVRGVMRGPVDPEQQALHQEATSFLDQCARAQRLLLAAEILNMYGVQLGEEQRSPFGQAGKPRALGADPPKPPA